MTGHGRYVFGYSCTRLGHSTSAPTTTEREIINTLATISCVVAAQLQLLYVKYS